MSYLALIARYWKAIAAVALIGLAYWWGYSTRAVACELAIQQMRNEALEDQAAAVEVERKRADRINERLKEALARPVVTAGVRDAVRKNPSTCSVSPDVGNGLRDAIAEANKAIAAQ